MLLHTITIDKYQLKFFKDSIGYYYTIYENGKKIDCSFTWKINSLAEAIEDGKNRIASIIQTDEWHKK